MTRRTIELTGLNEQFTLVDDRAAALEH